MSCLLKFKQIHRILQRGERVYSQVHAILVGCRTRERLEESGQRRDLLYDCGRIGTSFLLREIRFAVERGGKRALCIGARGAARALG
jgi:hypothetical protein